MCRQTGACWQLTAGSDKGEGVRGGGGGKEGEGRREKREGRGGGGGGKAREGGKGVYV